MTYALQVKMVIDRYHILNKGCSRHVKLTSNNYFGRVKETVTFHERGINARFKEKGCSQCQDQADPPFQQPKSSSQNALVRPCPDFKQRINLKSTI